MNTPFKIKETPTRLSLSRPQRLKRGRVKYPFKASRWRILINTNHRFTTQHRLDYAIDVMRQATVELKTEHNFEKFHIIKFVSGRRGEIPLEDDWEAIRKIKMAYVFELGEENQYLHEHIDLQINHNSRIHLDSKNLKAYYIQKLREAGFNEDEIKNLFVRIKLVKADMTEAYFQKTVFEDIPELRNNPHILELRAQVDEDFIPR